MIEIYCKLIINKRRALDRVPDDLKQSVVERLKELGYDADGNKYPEEQEVVDE